MNRRGDSSILAVGHGSLGIRKEMDSFSKEGKTKEPDKSEDNYYH